MTITREIPAGDWAGFLLEFNGRNYARPVRFETTPSSSGGAPLLAEHQPLIGVELDTKGSEAPAISVLMGGLEDRDPHFHHAISRPTRLWVEEEPRGLTTGLRIESRGERQTCLRFERGRA